MLDAQLIDEVQLRSLQARHAQMGGKPHDLAVDLGMVEEARIAGAIAAALNVPRLKLEEIPVDHAAMRKVPAEMCEQHGVFPCALRDDGKTLWVAMQDPLDIGAIDQIRARAQVNRVNAGAAGRNEIDQHIKLYYHGIQPNTGHSSDGSIEFSGSGEIEEEFKITDVSGATMVRHVPGVEQLRDDYSGGAAPAPVPAPAPAPAGAAFASAPPPPVMDPGGTFGSSGGSNLSGADSEALAKVQQGIERTNKVLRAIIELCIQKGFFTVEEYRSRVNS